MHVFTLAQLPLLQIPHPDLGATLQQNLLNTFLSFV